MIEVFFRTIPKTLHWLVSASLVLLFAKIFYFNDVPQPLPGCYELGIVLEGLLASIFASYIFYLIVVHTKETRDKAVIYPHITKWARCVVGDCKAQLADFGAAAGLALDVTTVSEGEVASALKRIDPHANAPLLFSLNQYANWLQYWLHYRTRSKAYISKIMAQLIYLDAPLVACVTAIDDCSHFYVIETVSRTPIRNTDMSAFSKSFYDYCLACRLLEQHLDAIRA